MDDLKTDDAKSEEPKSIFKSEPGEGDSQENGDSQEMEEEGAMHNRQGCFLLFSKFTKEVWNAWLINHMIFLFRYRLDCMILV